jgi:hypothetical protein
MSAGTWLPNGTKKSWLLLTLPLLVDNEMCPELTGDGTGTVIDVGVAEEASADVKLNWSRLLTTAGSKFVPVMVTAAPVAPFGGVKLEIVGAPFPLVTVNAPLLVAPPAGAVT